MVSLSLQSMPIVVCRGSNIHLLVEHLLCRDILIYVTKLNTLVYILLHRGSTFRHEFVNISEVRSIIPQSVNCMALTATATAKARRDIIETLCMGWLLRSHQITKQVQHQI